MTDQRVRFASFDMPGGRTAFVNPAMVAAVTSTREAHAAIFVQGSGTAIVVEAEASAVIAFLLTLLPGEDS